MSDRKKVESIKELAREAGFPDVRACADGSGSLFFLFQPYRPARQAEAGKINLSNYYIASQKGYLGMKRLLAALEKKGIRAREFKGNGVKQLALRTGGFIGKNSLYYHEWYGSFTSIHVVQTDVFCTEAPAQGETVCAACGSCAGACPSRAILPEGLDVSRCVRAHSNERNIPEEYREFIYQLLGCERCQLACPQNRAEQGEAYSFDIIGLLSGKYIREIRALVGPNYGRRRIILGQAAIYAANVGFVPALPAVQALFGDEFVGDAARWAAEVLKKS